MIPDPATAPPRPDLAFLRHRTLRTRSGAAPAGLADFVAGHAHHPTHGTPPAASTAPAAQPRAPVPVPVSASASLDLDDAPRPGAGRAPAAAPARPAAAPARRPPVTRVPASGRVVLDGTTPTVTLTPLQSGIGTLTIDAACSAEVGDLRLGCAYRLADGSTSVVSTMGERNAPAGARAPVLLAGHEQFDRISIDLRRVRELSRVMVYAFSASRTNLNWGGTLLASTHAGARVEAPLIGLDAGSVGVLLSIYQHDGELSLWTEMLAGANVRDACRAYGFDDITWLDDRTPVD